MILTTNVNLDLLSKQGKDFNWQKPSCCPGCNNRLWGHGYVRAYFDGYEQCLYLKRYRCPQCSIVITIRPSGYWKRFQSSIITIYKTLKYRLAELKWPPWTSRQRGGHWIRKLQTKIKMDYGLDNQGMKLSARLEFLFQKEIAFLG